MNSDLQSFDSNNMLWEESYVEQLKMSIPVGPSLFEVMNGRRRLRGAEGAARKGGNVPLREESAATNRTA